MNKTHARRRELVTPIPIGYEAPPERWQHGAEVAPHGPIRVAQRTVRGVETLRSSGDIGDAEVTAADRWYQDYATGVLGARDSGKASVGASDLHASMLYRCQSTTRAREMNDAIGAENTRWLVHFLIHEYSIAAMAAVFWPGNDRSTGSKKAGASISMLLTVVAATYHRLDRGKRA